MRIAGVCEAQRKRMFAASELPSASLPMRVILLGALRAGRNPAECGHLRPFIRTTGTGRQAYFGPFSGSLATFSLTQPNHAHFGTAVESLRNQCVRGGSRARGFERASLRRSEQGSNNSIQYGCRGDKDRAPRGVAGADRRGARQGRIGQAARAGRLTVASSSRVAMVSSVVAGEHGRGSDAAEQQRRRRNHPKQHRKVGAELGHREPAKQRRDHHARGAGKYRP